MKLARHDDKKIDVEQTCEANYYSASWHLIDGRPKEARPLLDSAAKSCPGTFIEHEAALAELERLDKQ